MAEPDVSDSLHVLDENGMCEVCGAVDNDLFIDVGCDAEDIVNPSWAIGWWLTPAEQALGIDVLTKLAAFPAGTFTEAQWDAACAAWREAVVARQKAAQ